MAYVINHDVILTLGMLIAHCCMMVPNSCCEQASDTLEHTKKEKIGLTKAYITAIPVHHTYMNKNHAFPQKST